MSVKTWMEIGDQWKAWARARKLVYASVVGKSFVLNVSGRCLEYAGGFLFRTVPSGIQLLVLPAALQRVEAQCRLGGATVWRVRISGLDATILISDQPHSLLNLHVLMGHT